MLANIFNRIYSTLLRPWLRLANKFQNWDTVPNVIHWVCDDDFLMNFDEVVIIGDIHGCYDEFCLLMDKIHQTSTDSKRILKICVGDLINKGPKNLEVIDYFMNNSDNCLSVRGNHDQLILDLYIKFQQTGELEEKNSWIKNLSIVHYNYLKQLPYTIRIPKLNAIVVHAGLVPNLDLEKQKLYDMTVIRNIIEKQDVNNQKEFIATKSDQEGVAWASIWPGPMHVYFGHDSKRKLQEHSFATGIDTGLVYGFDLTAKFIMGHREGNYLNVKALKAWKKIEK